MVSQKIKQEIETRFQLALTISILFPTFLATASQRVKTEDVQIAQTVLTWSILIGGFLLDYVFFSLIKNKIKNWTYVWVNRMLIFGISLFIFPILFLSTVNLEGPDPGLINTVGLQGSLYALLVVPLIILVILLISFLSFAAGKK